MGAMYGRALAQIPSNQPKFPCAQTASIMRTNLALFFLTHVKNVLNCWSEINFINYMWFIKTLILGVVACRPHFRTVMTFRLTMNPSSCVVTGLSFPYLDGLVQPSRWTVWHICMEINVMTSERGTKLAYNFTGISWHAFLAMEWVFLVPGAFIQAKTGLLLHRHWVKADTTTITLSHPIGLPRVLF